MTFGKRTQREAITRDSFDTARLVLRVAVGGTMIAHGVKHGRTLDGTAGWFASIGFREPQLQARLSAVVEVGSGAALLAGAATPLSASAVIGTMAVAYRTVHEPNGFFITDEGWEYVGILSCAAAALAGLGGGRYSVDRLMGVDHVGTPIRRVLTAIGLGLAGALGQLSAFWRKPEPHD